ncbi:hypothetical protein [Chthoniobacter flavus]|uniref:hypothetical protein n=1 Tax=Chthoniobacter flavus TaxID=191863 RepID=UPI0010526B21|nr:hypothetical protein [Chthoniobacter flavus]
MELGALGASESAESNAGPEAKAHALTAYYQEHTELPRNGAGPWIELVAQAGRPEELRKLSDQIARGRFDVEATIRAVDALAVAALNRQARPTPSGKETEPLANPDYQMLLRLLHSPDAKLRAASARLAGAWRQGYVGQELVSLASAGGSGPETKAAFEALRQIGGKTALAFFSVLARPDQKIETRCHALVAMAEIQLDAAIVKANDVLPAIQDEALATETWRRLLRVDRAANAFAVRLPGDLPRPVIEAGLQESRKLGKAGNSLTRALTRQSEERLRQQ